MASRSFIFVSLFNILLLVSLLIQVSHGKRVLPSKVKGNGVCASLVTPRGYKCEEHEVVTKDGYILGMQRIPFGQKGATGKGPRQPVLIQHGILVDGLTWLLNSPEQSLAFILADAGFDVWISNTRGTDYSRRHKSLDPNSRSYWDWSWDALVKNDYPATVKYVYKQTGQKLHYVGHSLGTTVALASFSQGRLVDKLKSAALLTPVAYLAHMKTPVGILGAKTFLGEVGSGLLGISEFNPSVTGFTDVRRIFCLRSGVDCFKLLTTMTGSNCCLNATTMELLLKYEPQSTSTKTWVQLSQNFRDRQFKKYDYGSSLNMKKYGQTTPPVYNLTNIPRNLPLFLSYGGRDYLSDEQDVKLLLDDLKYHKTDKLSVQFVKDFGHVDYMMGVTANEAVYQPMISFIHKHDK